MKQFEFQFRWDGRQSSSFGFDVTASSIKGALEKANRFLDYADGECWEIGDPNILRIWVSVIPKVTANNIKSIYGPLKSGCSARHYTVPKWRKEFGRG